MSYTSYQEDFLEKESLKILHRLEEIWSAEEKVLYTRLGKKDLIKLRTGELLLEQEISKKNLKRLTSKQKISLYILLSFLEYSWEDDPEKFTIFKAWKCFLENLIYPYLHNNEVFSVASQLSRIDRLNFFRKYLQSEKHWKTFLNGLKNKQRSKKGYTVESLENQLFQGLLGIKFILRTPRKPNKPQFHRGYRDHGSLGSEVSRIRKEESKDLFLKEELEKRKKEQELQLLHYYRHFLGI